jgi:hypothetical protein
MLALARRSLEQVAEPPSTEELMPQKWSSKRERQYEHIKDSELERGRGEDRAKEIAARTVNKQRREDGETENKKSQGTGSPSSRLENRTLDELKNRASQLGIQSGRMSKTDLIRAIRGKR